MVAHVRVEIRDAVVATVERVTELRVLRGGQDVDVLEQKIARRFKRFLRHSVSHQLVIFVERGAQREMSIHRLDGSNPDLENLLLASKVRVWLKLKHAAREIFYVGVVAVVQTA